MDQNPIRDRNDQFQSGFDALAYKSRAEKSSQERRHSNRQEVASKKRFQIDLDYTSEIWPDLSTRYQTTYTVEDLNWMVHILGSTVLEDRLEIAHAIRKILSMAQTPPIQRVIDIGAIPFLIQWIQDSGTPQLQYESCWCISNIASGNHKHCRRLVEIGVIPFLVSLLESGNPLVRVQAFWAIANICYDDSQYRDIMLKSGWMVQLLEVLGNTHNQQDLQTGLWTLCSLIRGEPPVDYTMVAPATPVIWHYIKIFDDMNVLSSLLWALRACARLNVLDIVAQNINERLLELISHTSENVSHPTLKIIGHMIYNDTQLTQYFISQGLLPLMRSILAACRRPLKKDIVMVFSNIAVESSEAWAELVRSNIHVSVFQLIDNCTNEVKKECLYVLGNLICTSTPDTINILLNANLVAALAAQLQNPTDNINTKIALQSLRKLLEIGTQHFVNQDQINMIATQFEQCGGLDILEKLQHHQNQKIYSDALSIVENFYTSENSELLSTIMQIANDSAVVGNSFL